MPFPLGAVLSAAPGVLGAASDIIKLIRQNKDTPAAPELERLEQLTGLVERQAMVIEELAQNNRDLALAVRNNRILSVTSLVVAVVAVVAVIV